jgi:hypothetical protein
MSKSKSPEVINTTRIQISDFIQNRPGTYRAIVKTQSGALISYTVGDIANYPEDSILANWKKGALQTLEFTPAGSTTDRGLTVFARKGKKILWIDQQIAVHLKVGTVNQLFYNTDLYNQTQYQSVNAKTWDSYVFRMNKTTGKK